MLYNKDNFIKLLNRVDWLIQRDTVQGCWNEIEKKYIKIVDKIAPLQKFKNNSCIESKTTPSEIKKIWAIEKKSD
jgi:hypothetical protein